MNRREVIGLKLLIAVAKFLLRSYGEDSKALGMQLDSIIADLNKTIKDE